MRGVRGEKGVMQHLGLSRRPLFVRRWIEADWSAMKSF